ncbi:MULTISPECIES: GNAT family N-acetyltransferase [unclassified Bradyrhizobium]|uniref:GNAT family N-acetyltransferase n=1 Tax=unclassified Bradyrhizobium TaxID=2631580 RepID=UPI002916BF64|nr:MULTISPECIES: GNAT family N-acetyltransferase [unclassified Bradyrhizobium]
MEASARADGIVSLVPVTSGNLHEVNAIFDELTAYSQRVDGVSRRNDAADTFMTAVPAGHALKDKHAFVAKRRGAALGLLDMIDGYPLPGTAFIGLLAVRESAQGSGIGRALFREAERFARDSLRARNLRLAVVESNPVIGFWTKMGFHPTGEVKPFSGEANISRAILMEKEFGPTVSSSAL